MFHHANTGKNYTINTGNKSVENMTGSHTCEKTNQNNLMKLIRAEKLRKCYLTEWTHGNSVLSNTRKTEALGMCACTGADIFCIRPYCIKVK
jgi:hypothetical protein